MRGILIVSIVLFSGGIIGSYVSGQLEAIWYFVAIDLLFILCYLWEVKRITVDENAINIKNFFRKKTLKYSDIKDVSLQNDSDGRGNLISTVFLFMKDGKPVKIAGIHGGTIAVYESIKSAWQRNQGIFAKEK